MVTHQPLAIDGRTWLVAPHPSATDMPHGQEGRAAIVYCLVAADHAYTEPVRVLRGSGAFHVPPDGTPIRLGRGPRNDVVLEEAAVSREHGALVVQRGRLFFWDNSSRNGTLLGGDRVEPQKWVLVPPGSRLQLGALEHGVPLAVRPQAGSCRALKVFKPRFRQPRLVELSERLAPFAALPGLRVCERRVLTPQEHRDLLAAEDGLVYAALMPWIEGRTWMEHLLERELLAPAASLALATRFLDVLARLEQRGMAHCDLSGPNVAIGDGLAIELLDVEQLYGPGLVPPDDLFAGSPGYAHRNLGDDTWSAYADRFSGAVLAAEMLGWCDEGVAGAACGESFFEPGELHADSQRFRHLAGFLEATWGARVSRLFERAWHSGSPAECPTFGEWLVALPQQVPASAPAPVPGAAPAAAPAPVPAAAPASDPAPIDHELDRARRLEEGGDLPGALKAYRLALGLADPDSAAGRELALIVRHLEARVPAPGPETETDLRARIRELEGPPGLPEPARPPAKAPRTLGPAAFAAVLAGLGTVGILLLGGLYLWMKYGH